MVLEKELLELVARRGIDVAVRTLYTISQDANTARSSTLRTFSLSDGP
jgi:hypothetical protein